MLPSPSSSDATGNSSKTIITTGAGSPTGACTVSSGEADAQASLEVGATNKNTAVTTTGATAKKRNTERSDLLR